MKAKPKARLIPIRAKVKTGLIPIKSHTKFIAKNTIAKEFLANILIKSL